MTATALTRTATRTDDPVLRDRRHKDARAARDVADWLSWLDLGGHSPRTLDQYERDLAVLLNAFPEKTLAEFTDGDLAFVLKRWRQPSTRRTRKSSYASFFGWAVRTRRLEQSPMVYLPDIKAAPQRVQAMHSDAEVEQLSALPQPDGILMRLLFDTGIRKGEARHLRARNVDLDRGQLIILNGKGGKDRVIPLTDRALHAAADVILLDAIRPDQFLWYSHPGGGRLKRDRPVGEGSFHRWWDRCIEQAGVQRHNPHSSRHYFATNCLRKGIPLQEVSMLLGHSSIKTTFDLYAHMDVTLVDVSLLERT